MSRYSKDHQVNVRLPGPYKAALDRIIADVQGLTSLKFNGEKVSFEALISSWILHFAERGHGEVVAVLERHLPAIGRDYEAIRVSRIKEPPAEEPGTVPPQGEQPKPLGKVHKPRKPKGKARPEEN